MSFLSEVYLPKNSKHLSYRLSETSILPNDLWRPSHFPPGRPAHLRQDRSVRSEAQILSPWHYGLGTSENGWWPTLFRLWIALCLCLGDVFQGLQFYPPMHWAEAMKPWWFCVLQVVIQVLCLETSFNFKEPHDCLELKQPSWRRSWRSQSLQSTGQTSAVCPGTWNLAVWVLPRELLQVAPRRPHGSDTSKWASGQNLPFSLGIQIWLKILVPWCCGFSMCFFCVSMLNKSG